jgi:hypothetical protein
MFRLRLPALAQSWQRGSASFHRHCELRGLGAFSVKQRNARIGRNPRTGETIQVDEKAAPFFKAGKENAPPAHCSLPWVGGPVSAHYVPATSPQRAIVLVALSVHPRPDAVAR